MLVIFNQYVFSLISFHFWMFFATVTAILSCAIDKSVRKLTVTSVNSVGAVCLIIVSVVAFLAIFAIACHAATIQKPSEERKQPELFEIDVDAVPEEGSIQGLRIRRSGDLSKNIPEIDIQQINDDLISVNGIRLKRSDLKDLSDVELDEEASEDGEANDRTRRSGGGDLLGFIGQKIGQKISAFASSSSGHHAESDLHYGTPVTSYSTKTFDFWAFKKAIVATLLQAVKAIKGGVIALGGQLIKAKGQLISTKGKIIATKGDSITDFGRDIAAKALLSPSHGSSATAYATAAVDHIPETGFSTAGLASGYAGPTQPGFVGVSASYGVPTQHGYNKRGATSQQFAVPHERVLAAFRQSHHPGGIHRPGFPPQRSPSQRVF